MPKYQGIAQQNSMLGGCIRTSPPTVTPMLRSHHARESVLPCHPVRFVVPAAAAAATLIDLSRAYFTTLNTTDSNCRIKATHRYL